MRGDFIGSLIEFYNSKRAYYDKSYKKKPSLEARIKKGVYDEIIEDLVRTKLAYEKADTRRYFLPEDPDQPVEKL